MLPFAQPSSAPPGASASHQVPGNSTNLLPNLMQINSQTGFVNPQSSLPFNNPNTHMGYGTRPPGLMNFPQFNGHLGNSILGSVPQNFVQNSNVSPFPYNGQLRNLNQGNHGQLFGQNLLNVAQQLNQASGFQNGQFGWPNQMQNLSQLGNMPLLNPSQVAALAQLMGCANQVAQGIIPQTTTFAGNPHQLGHVQPNGAVLQTNLGQSQQMPMTPQQMPMTPQQMPMTPQQMPMTPQQMPMTPQQMPMTPQQMPMTPQLMPMTPQQMPMTPQQMPMTSQQMPMAPQQMPMTPQQMQSSTSNPQHSQSPRLQGNPGNRHGMHISNSDHHRNKNFLKNPQRDASNPRFQKHRDQHMHNTKGKHKFSDENKGKGIKSSGPDNAANSSKSGNQRSLSMFYSEKEIQQWCEERKKHYPSKANVEKKLADKQANADAAVEAAKLRRQQLKDVLAKQVELGFEVPEIPSHYLLDSEEQCHGKDENKNPPNSGRFQNKFNKRGKFDRFDKKRGREGNGSFRKHKQFAKRKRGEGDDSPKSIPLNHIKKQTLLQKLLSTDIKRDNQCLLQAMRFMVMNSFFKDWPGKSLDFPKVIVKETVTATGNDVIEHKPFSLKGQLIENHDTFDVHSDGGHDGCQEEGEITD